jgi:hypothetical protein
MKQLNKSVESEHVEKHLNTGRETKSEQATKQVGTEFPRALRDTRSEKTVPKIRDQENNKDRHTSPDRSERRSLDSHRRKPERSENQ